MWKSLRKHIHIFSAHKKIPGQAWSGHSLRGNLHLKNKVLKLGFSKGFWMLPFPTKYKDESVDDYLQYQVTQPLCHLGGGKEAWPKKPTVFFFSLSLWLSIESSGDASKPGINLSFGKVATLKKKACLHFSVWTPQLLVCRDLVSYIFEDKLGHKTGSAKCKAFLSLQRVLNGLSRSPLEFAYTLQPK